MGRSPGFHLSDKLVREIEHLGQLRAPAEACGVLLPTPLYKRGSQVVEIPNRALRANEYNMLSSDISYVLKEWHEGASDEEIASIMLWHTHPSGLVGPSAGDLEVRVDGVTYLVVTLTAEGPVPTYF